jgi:flavin reductase
MNKKEVALTAFRNAMAQLGTAVHVVTTDGAGGRAGFTASAVCSVTDTPPSVLVCINKASSAYAATRANGVLCINTLSADQHSVSTAFSAKMQMAERFKQGEWIQRSGRPPLLAGSIVTIDCEVVNAVTVGSHDVLVCEVGELQANTHSGILIYYGDIIGSRETEGRAFYPKHSLDSVRPTCRATGVRPSSASPLRTR